MLPQTPTLLRPGSIWPECFCFFKEILHRKRFERLLFENHILAAEGGASRSQLSPNVQD
jgi:hypothetical protein